MNRHTKHTKLLKIGQAHLARNMNLVKWREIISRYPTLNGSLDSLADEDLERIIGEIKHIVLFGNAGDPPAAVA